MSMPLEALEAEVLRLSPAQRSQLMDRVVASRDTDTALDAAWDAEADRREAETNDGTMAPIAGRDVLARLRGQVG